MKTNRILPVIGTVVLCVVFQTYGQRYIQRDVQGASRVNGAAFNWDRSGDNPLNSANVVGTVSDGLGTYQRGFSSILTDVQVHVDHVLTGFIAAEANINGNNNSYPTYTTTIFSHDDPNVAAVYGSNSTDSRRQRRNRPTPGFFVISRHNNPTSMGTWTLHEGNYFGGENNDGAHVTESAALNLNGTSLIGGDGTSGSYSSLESDLDPTSILIGNTGLQAELVGTVTINNRTRSATHFDVIRGGDGDSDALETVQNQMRSISGGNAIHMTGGTLRINGGDFYAGNAKGESLIITSGLVGISSNSTALAEGAAAIRHVTPTQTRIDDGYFMGGSAGRADMKTYSGLARASGGIGVDTFGVATIAQGTFIGGEAGKASVTGTMQAEADAQGGHAIRLTGGNSTIAKADARATAGGFAIALGSNTVANASGGNGVYARTAANVTISGGTFQGERGGTAIAVDTATADGGSGVRAENSTLTINGGTFSGARAGLARGANATARAGRGIFAVNSGVTINDATGTNTVINDGIYFSNAGKTLSFQGGTVNGEILFEGAGNSTFTVSSSAVNNGRVVQNGGVVSVISVAGAASFFNDVTINGRMKFNSDFITAAGSSFTLLNTDSEVDFNSLFLSDGSTINAGMGDVITTSGKLEISTNSSISLTYDGQTGEHGLVKLGANSLVMSAPSARILVSGTSAAPTGSFTVVSSTGAITLSTNANIQAYLGSLVKTTNVVNAAGVNINFDYNSLSNRASLADLNVGDFLSTIDDSLTSSNAIASGLFYNINKLEMISQERLVRYSETQVPDAAEAGFQTQQQIAQQIAARGTEFRSMNGFASTKPRFGKTSAPVGAAGPQQDAGDMQGWARAYGSSAERDRQGSFAAYDAKTYGSVIGVDKNFGNLLIGLAGGAGVADIDAGDTYSADVTTYHGSIYSTIGGEDLFVDLALTYGTSETESKNIIANDGFDSFIFSGYLGGGKSFNANDSLKITPEASLLTSYYEQDAYNRGGLIPKTIQAYDEWSYLAAIGVNVSAQHQIDWMVKSLAVLPEIRAHWLHEFNPDMKDFSYTTAAGGRSFGVRAREENLFRLGLGLDIWSWRYDSAKFEIDYDGLFSADYVEHAVSGKVSLQF